MRVLVVDDDQHVVRALSRMVRLLGHTANVATSVRAATTVLGQETFDVVLLDFQLDDGTALDLVTVCRALHPVPRMIAITGAALGRDAFLLGQRGVRAFLHKPVTMTGLAQALEEPSEIPLPLEAAVEQLVGAQDPNLVAQRVRRAMLDHALAVTGGNQVEAARLLGVSRQAINKRLARTPTKRHAPREDAKRSTR